MFLKVATAPAIEPLTLVETKLHLKVSVSTDDALITRLIQVAREFCEDYTNRSFITTTWQLYLDIFPEVIYLERTPNPTVSWVKYYDETPTLQILGTANYTKDEVGEPGRIRLADGYTWPTIKVMLNAVQVQYTAGYGATAASVPEAIKEAMLLHIGHNYDNRGDEGHRKYPKAIYDLLDKVRTF